MDLKLLMNNPKLLRETAVYGGQVLLTGVALGAAVDVGAYAIAKAYQAKKLHQQQNSYKNNFISAMPTVAPNVPDFSMNPPSRLLADTFKRICQVE